MPTGNIFFPGISQPKHLHATRTLGSRPDAAVLYAQPQPGSPDCTGTATLSFNFNGNTVNWTNALCDRGTFAVSTGGHYQVFTILDRRWYWSKCYITRAYNVRNPDGSIDTATTATLSQIVADLFTAIGGITYDISAVSSGEYPEIVFDHDNVADAMEELLNPRGYVICLNTDDSVTIWVRGRGATLPAGSELVNASISIDPPEIPLYLTALASKTLVQSKLKMAPVGLDTDGTIKAVASLSYAPAGGWDDTDMETFDFITDPVSKELAKLSVGKWFQVATQADGSFTISGYNPTLFTVTSPWQYLPLDGKLLDTYTDPMGKLRQVDSFVEGTFYQDDKKAQAPQGQNTATFSLDEDRSWSLDAELGIIKCDTLCVMKNPGPVSGVMTFSDIYFVCSYSVHDNTSFVKDRYYRSMNMGGLGIDMRELDELQRQIKVVYAGGDATATSVVDNQTTMDSLADAYLTTAANSYFTKVGDWLLYRGIFNINTDGVALQVKWDVAVPGQPVPFGTYVTQYCEGIPLLPTEREKEIVRRSKLAADPMTARKIRYRASKRRVREE